jgi:hypothetical protein
MADSRSVIVSSTLLHTGKGELYGLVITASTGAPLVTIYDNTAGSGTKIFEAYVSSTIPLIIFFQGQFAPRFATGLYVTLAANLTATIWFRGV